MHYDQIYRFCVAMLGNLDEGLDATQNIFQKAHRGFSGVRKSDSVKSWLYQIARNECIDRKRWWNRTVFALKTLNRELERPKTSNQELSVIVTELVQRLPERQREVFILRHWHEYSTEETAKLLGIDIGTVKSHLSRAIASLKAELTGEFF